MGARHQFVVLAPSLLGPVPSMLADGARDVDVSPSFTRFLSRAKRQNHQKAMTGESVLLQQLSRDDDPHQTALPTAGAIAASALQIHGHRWYYQAAPVHLRPDRDRVLLFAGDGLRVNAEESEELINDFNQLYANDEITLHYSNGHWVLGTEQPLGPDLPPLARVAGRYLDAVMPTDESFRRWRQLLNEIQMFLHDHPINQRRLAAGELAINGFWFWEGGAKQPLNLREKGRLIGGNVLCQGIAQLADIPIESAQNLNDTASFDYTLVLWDRAEQALMSGDAQAWLQALSAFDNELGTRFATWLETPRTSIVLDTGAATFTANHRQFRWQFWRTNQALPAWIQRA